MAKEILTQVLALWAFGALFNAFVAPAQACGTGGFIQAGNQIACIRAATAEEMAAHRENVRLRVARRQAEEAAAAKRARAAQLDQQAQQAGRDMDAAADRILEKGGRERYRNALENYVETKSAADMLRMGL